MPLAQLVDRDRAVAMRPRDLGAFILDDLLRTDPQLRTKTAYSVQALAGWDPQPGPRDAIELGINDPEAAEALEEAFHWLEREGLVREEPGSHRLALTRSGRALQRQGVPAVRQVPAGVRELADQLHPRFGTEVRDSFMDGRFQAAVNRAGIALEDAVRALTGSPAHGERLFTSAFAPNGALRDPNADPNEADGTTALFAGFIKRVRNPGAHRAVDYSDPLRGIADVLLADRLMREVADAAARLGRGF